MEGNSRVIERNSVCYCLSLLTVATVRYAYQSLAITTVFVYENVTIVARGLKSTRALAPRFETTHRVRASSNRLAHKGNRILQGIADARR